MILQDVQDKKLSLSNDGRLSFFFVGVGSAFSKRHYQNNLLIIKGQDHLMVDCGTKTPQAIYELGIPITQIRNFYITHSHADHIGGLEEVMLMSRYVLRQKPHIWITEVYQHLLWDMSLRGGCSFNDVVEGRDLTFGDHWEIHRPDWLEGYPRETYGFKVGSLQFKAMRTKHIPADARNWSDSSWSTGLVVDDRILFSGDTRFDPQLVTDYCSRFNIEYIFHDCQFFPPGGVHASIDELKDLPASIKSKMILMHYGDDWERNEEKVKSLGFHSLARQWTYYVFN